MVIRSHRDLIAWKKSIELTDLIYLLCKKLPRDEMFLLSAHLKKTVVSVASNIAEGAKRRTEKDFVRFLYIALGSLSELDTQLEIARRQYAVDIDQALYVIEEVTRIINGLKSKLSSATYYIS